MMCESSEDDVNVMTRNISSNIQRITQLTGEIQQMMNYLGTAQDTPDLRQRLHQKQQNANQLAKATDEWMRKFSSLPVTTEQRQRKIQRDGLITEFSSALAVFQKTQRLAAEKQREFVARVRASSRGGATDDAVGGVASHFESEVQPQSFEEITEEDLGLILERESAIRQLESDITDINEIFKDLGMMVHEQRDMIDSIEASLEEADMSVQSATQQLSRAADYQKSSRKKLCVVVAVGVAGAVLMALIIWASVKL